MKNFGSCLYNTPCTIASWTFISKFSMSSQFADTSRKGSSNVGASPKFVTRIEPFQLDIPDGPEREKWGTPSEVLMSCIALSVGLGNIWKFPYTACTNGGGAFLIPYLIVLTVIGRPIYFLEIAIGQFSSYGQVKVWGVCPFFKGIGYGSLVGNISVASYYAMLMGLTLFYLFASFQKTLPWAECDDRWLNLGSGIIDTPETVDCPLEPKFFCNSSSPSLVFERDGNGNPVPSNISLSKLYFENEVLNQKYDISDGLGSLEWRLTLCLLLAWLLIWGSLVRGIQGSGKVAYFTALFPFAILLIMFIRGITLPNSWEGIKYLLNPEWEKLIQGDVWFEAVNQCFFSLSTGFGPLIMFGSYNDFHRKSSRDAWIVSGLDTFTSFFAGLTVFAVLGNLAGEIGVEVKDVARDGAGLAFISFAQGIASFNVVPQLFSVLFYLMLLILGIGSAVPLTQSLVTVICDDHPHWRRWNVTTCICGSGFLIGLIYVTRGGIFMLDLVNHFGTNYIIFFMTMLEVMAIAWIYGVNNFIRDLQFMMNIKLGWYWKFCWAFTIPIGLVVILTYSLITEKRFTSNELDYPDIALVFGWILTGFGIALVPIFGIVAVKNSSGNSLLEKIKNSFVPTSDWGPKNAAIRKAWLEMKDEHI